MTVRFDESLPRLSGRVDKLFGSSVLAQAAVVRDAGGRLSVVLPIQVEPEKLTAAEDELRDALEAYARPDRVISDVESPGAKWLLQEASRLSPVSVGNCKRPAPRPAHRRGGLAEASGPIGHRRSPHRLC